MALIAWLKVTKAPSVMDAGQNTQWQMAARRSLMRVRFRAIRMNVGGQQKQILTNTQDNQKMNSGNVIKIIVAVLLLAGAAFGFHRFFSKDDGIAEKAFFYDLSEKKMFTASREALPPIKGVNDPTEDGVRAIVICVSGNPEDPANQKTAYLEKYAPELKLNIEQARLGKVEPMSTRERNAYRLVARVGEDKWHSATSSEGQKIMTSWHVAGADGKYPAVCSP